MPVRLTTAFQSCVWLLPALTFPSRQDSVCLVRFLRIFKIVGVEICVQVGTCSRSFKWTKIKIAWVFLLFALLLIVTVCQVNECFCFMKEHTSHSWEALCCSRGSPLPSGYVSTWISALQCGTAWCSPGLFTLSQSSEPEGPQLQVACVKHQS